MIEYVALGASAVLFFAAGFCGAMIVCKVKAPKRGKDGRFTK